MGHGADAVRDFSRGVAGARALAAENASLRSQLAALRLYTQRERILLQEVDSLRKAIGLKGVGSRTRVPADIVGYYPHERRITLSVGRASGVRAGMPVVAGTGLLGVVHTVDAKTCQANLVWSPQVTVGAMVDRQPPEAGLLRGESPDALILDFLEGASKVEVGDWVVTSGFSEVIPRGIPIGRVVRMDNEPDFGKRRARVSPSVNLGSLREVFVLR